MTKTMTKITTRLHTWAITAALALLACVPSFALAQAAWPAKPIVMLVAFPPGSGNDAIAREIARFMATDLGQPVVVENKEGAGGVIATNAVAKAAPDGYTIGLGTSSQFVMNVGINSTLPFDVDKDFTPLGLVSKTPMALMGKLDGPRTLREFIARAAATPDGVTYGSGGVGSVNQIMVESFARKAGVKLRHIPYRGSGPAALAVAGGHVDMTIVGMTSITPLVGPGTDNKAVVLAVSGDRRSKALPQVPTFKEAGLPGYEAYTWNNLYGPAGMPPDIVKRLNASLNKALASPQLIRFAETAEAVITAPSTPAQAAAFEAKERAFWVPFIRQMKVRS